MYVLRCTEPLRRAALRHLERAAEDDRATTRLGDWYAIRLNVGPQRYVLATNATSLLSVVVPAKDLRRLPDRVAAAVDPLLQRIGVPAAARTREVDGMRAARIGRVTSRSVLSSIRWLAEYAVLELHDVPHRPGRSLAHVNVWLAQVPMGALGQRAPADAALGLLAAPAPGAPASPR